MVKDNLYFLLYLSIFEIFGDFALEKYANGNGKNNIYYLLIGCIFYICVVYFLIKSLEGSNILYVNGMWDGISALIESLAAMIFLGQSFDNCIQYVGLIFIILGILFIKNNNPFIQYYNYVKKQF